MLKIMTFDLSLFSIKSYAEIASSKEKFNLSRDLKDLLPERRLENKCTGDSTDIETINILKGKKGSSAHRKK